MKVGTIMNEAVKIKIAVVKEEDFKPVVLEVFNDESGIEGISDLVSKSGEISYLDLSNIGLENILLVIDGRPINSKGGYNFSIQIYPIFGPAVFMQFGIDADGNAIVVDMDEETLGKIAEFVNAQKTLEKEQGLKDSIIADINKYGRDGYIKRMDAMFNEASLDEQYEKAKKEQEAEDKTVD